MVLHRSTFMHLCACEPALLAALQPQKSKLMAHISGHPVIYLLSVWFLTDKDTKGEVFSIFASVRYRACGLERMQTATTPLSWRESSN